MHVSDLSFALKGISLNVLTHMWPALHDEGHHLQGMSHSVAVSAHSSSALEMITMSSLYASASSASEDFRKARFGVTNYNKNVDNEQTYKED
jgi:hypothetical protein